MITIIGIIVIIVGLLVYVGQSLSFLAPELATKIGLNDPEDEMDDSLYIIETKANGLSDMLLTWTLPLPGPTLPWSVAVFIFISPCSRSFAGCI